MTTQHISETMRISEDNVESLRQAYTTAVEQQKETFTWEGYDLLTAYAKYLLEYVDIVLPKRK